MNNAQIEVSEPIKLKALTDIIFQLHGDPPLNTVAIQVTGLNQPHSFVRLDQRWQWVATDRRIIYEIDEKQSDVSYQHIIQVTTGKEKISVDPFTWFIELFRKNKKPAEIFYACLTTQVGCIILTGIESEIRNLAQTVRDEKENVLRLIMASEVKKQVIGTSSRSQEIQESIERLAKLAGDGYISMDEFKQKKQELLNQL